MACVLWLTGLSGSGKSTLAQEVHERLKIQGLPVEHLDGDKIREVFSQTGFDRISRNEHVCRIGFLASLLEKHGVTVIVSLISPYRESRDFARKLCGNFIEIHINTPLETCEARDPKGLYLKARQGKIANFTGLDAPYEPPRDPELSLDTSQISVDESVERIMMVLQVYQVQNSENYV